MAREEIVLTKRHCVSSGIQIRPAAGPMTILSGFELNTGFSPVMQWPRALARFQLDIFSISSFSVPGLAVLTRTGLPPGPEALALLLQPGPSVSSGPAAGPRMYPQESLAYAGRGQPPDCCRSLQHGPGTGR